MAEKQAAAAQAAGEGKASKGKGRDQRQGQPVRERVVKLRTLKYPIALTAETTVEYLAKEGGRMMGAINRLGILQRMVGREPAIKQRLDAWVDMLRAEVQEGLEAFGAQVEALAARMPTKGAPKVTVEYPASFVWEATITHPIAWEAINAVTACDRHISEIENFWLMMLISQEEMEQARHQTLNILRRIESRIYMMTRIGKREGGQFSAQAFLNAVRRGAPIEFGDGTAEVEPTPETDNSVAEAELTEQLTEMREAS